MLYNRQLEQPIKCIFDVYQCKMRIKLIFIVNKLISNVVIKTKTRHLLNFIQIKLRVQLFGYFTFNCFLLCSLFNDNKKSCYSLFLHGIMLVYISIG